MGGVGELFRPPRILLIEIATGTEHEFRCLDLCWDEMGRD